jgi:predicted amidohydrolase
VAANRIGKERGTHYLGRSVITGINGEMLVEGPRNRQEILIADIELERSENKARIFSPGEYELNLFKDRNPELYDVILKSS